MSLGARSGSMSPICDVGLWRVIGIPTCLYGCELWNALTATEISILERVQRYAAKCIQGLAANTRTEAAIGNIGLWEMEEYIDKAKLIYFGRLCKLNPETTTKKVFITRLFSFLYKGSRKPVGFIPDLVRIFEKYNLVHFLKYFIDEKYFPSKNEWQKIVICKLHQFQVCKWREGIARKAEICHYQNIHTNLSGHTTSFRRRI